MENTASVVEEMWFTAPLPHNKRPILTCVCLCGSVFTESLPSSGFTCYSDIVEVAHDAL
jgi:hypothetical protein